MAFSVVVLCLNALLYESAFTRLPRLECQHRQEGKWVVDDLHPLVKAACSFWDMGAELAFFTILEQLFLELEALN
jgi:hypothetical protein